MRKKLRIGFGFGETVAVEGPGSDALSRRAASEFENQPALELSKRPALIFRAGRITVDAREKD